MIYVKFLRQCRKEQNCLVGIAYFPEKPRNLLHLSDEAGDIPGGITWGKESQPLAQPAGRNPQIMDIFLVKGFQRFVPAPEKIFPTLGK
jgi:hypothetical protein